MQESGENKQTEEIIKRMISKLSGRGESYTKDVREAIPILLRYAISLEPRRPHWPKLSGFHQYNGDPTLEASYYGHDGDIYAIVDDFRDPLNGRGGLEKVSEETFLRWALQDRARLIEVYENLVEYIQQEDQKPPVIEHSEIFEGFV